MIKFWDWILGRADSHKPEPPHIVVFKDEAKQWRWNARGGNGQIICTSEAFDNYSNACRAAQSLIDNPPTSMEVRA